MTPSDHSTQNVVVAGDVTIDWNITCVKRSAGDTAGWSDNETNTHAYRQRGGAALLADLIEALSGTAHTVRQMAMPQAQIVPGDPRFHHAYSLWTRYPYSNRPEDPKKAVWRMAEWLGMERSPTGANDDAWPQIVDDDADAALVILDDADLGFRDQPQRWPLAIQGGNRPWILVKMAQPVAQGPLWERLHRQYTDRLIVVTTINDLRQTEVQISRQLSWERTAQDLAWELVYNPRINSLAHCAHVVVTFGVAGAMLVSRRADPANGAGQTEIQSCLIFDTQVIEGMWELTYPGHMTGYTSCLTAALAYQILRSPRLPDIKLGVQRGLAATRTLHQEGYGSQGSSPAYQSAGEIGLLPAATEPKEEVRFPIGLVIEEVMSPAQPFAVAQVQDPGRNLAASNDVQRHSKGGLWTILEERYTGELGQVAHQIVLQGAEVAMQGVPMGQFGAMLTVDRQEIESFRSLRALVGEYCLQPNPKRPLSIAVFGAPGSGKSFGVTEVARSLLPGQIEKLEFNLSQFDTPDQLLEAFHRVRDMTLSGHIPLVFWDEFDTALDNQPLGWLRHFLAPMQDGLFQQGQIAHPLGRTIFVFAGGTRESMQAFDQGRADPTFRAAKGPDFVSRLRGYVDIVGPNPKGGDRDADRYYTIRRAILLRQLLRRNAPQIFHWQNGIQTPEIDSGLLRAFLTIPTYKHGARSMESIIATSTLAGKGRFERSALPTEIQLNLHVDGSQFLSLVQQIELVGDLLEKLAQAAHEIYRLRVQARGDTTLLSQRTYAELSDEEKVQNRQTVRDIPTKLAYAGYVMRPARSDEPSFDFPDGDREQLAELEHERWLKDMVSAGWRYGAETDRARKVHSSLVPWRARSSVERAQRYAESENAVMGLTELPESEKEKDRDLIDGIPLILARAGYTLIKVRADGEHES